MDFIPAQHENKEHRIKHDPIQSLLETPSPTLCTVPPAAHQLLRCNKTHLNTFSFKNNMQLILQGHKKAALCPARMQIQGKKRLRNKENRCYGLRKGGIKVSQHNSPVNGCRYPVFSQKQFHCCLSAQVDMSSEQITLKRSSQDICLQPQHCTMSL